MINNTKIRLNIFSGQTIQQSSEQRLWIQLSDSVPTASESILEIAKQELYESGFPSDGVIFGGGENSKIEKKAN